MHMMLSTLQKINNSNEKSCLVSYPRSASRAPEKAHRDWKKEKRWGPSMSYPQGCANSNLFIPDNYSNFHITALLDITIVSFSLKPW